jgi:hypothetical protein
MPYTEGNLMRQMNPLVRARKNAVSGITAVLGLALFITKAKEIISLPFSVTNYEYLALLATTGALVYLWIWASEGELEMLGKWLDPKEYAVPSSIKETVMIMGLAAFLVSLFFAASDILWYSILFLLYMILDFLALRYAHLEIRLATDASYTRLRESGGPTVDLFAQAVRQIEVYYFVRPHDLRRIVVFVAMLVVAVLAYIGRGDDDELFTKLPNDDPFTKLAYGLCLLTIIASEFVIGYWRQARDSELRMFAAKLSEAERQTDGPKLS